ncbi:MAG: FAD-binding protein [Gammaproteobacteria bacterium]|nr:FAD-binding protein [Gammaproteobacteria bacterium]
MTLYIIAEHDHQHLDVSISSLMTAALQLDPKPVVLVLGYQCGSVAEEAATLSGVAEVWLLDDPAFEHPLAEQMAPVIVSKVQDATHVLMASTTFGKNLLPRVAALLDVAQLSDVTAVINANTYERPIYAGNAVEVVESLDQQQIISIRPTAFAAASETQAAAVVQTWEAEVPTTKTHFLRRELSESERPDLGNAKIVVSGGRGLQSAEQFKLVEDLADALGAALGASRAAVDAGFISNDHQVGQTGKIVAPNLYIAVGISGAIQHLAGIKDSHVIVAINKDENAPIFQIANYGLVGDLFDMVPQLISELKQRGLYKC